MSDLALERPKMGRKKKEVPSDYAAIKVDRSVYIDLKLISLYERKEIAEVATELLRAAAAKRRKSAEAKRAAEEARKK
jgi:hypothetical protein